MTWHATIYAEVRFRIDVAYVTYSNWTAPLKEATYFVENWIGTFYGHGPEKGIRR
jgi:hypothetical protein